MYNDRTFSAERKPELNMNVHSTVLNICTEKHSIKNTVDLQIIEIDFESSIILYAFDIFILNFYKF